MSPPARLLRSRQLPSLQRPHKPGHVAVEVHRQAAHRRLGCLLLELRGDAAGATYSAATSRL